MRLSNTSNTLPAEDFSSMGIIFLHFFRQFAILPPLGSEENPQNGGYTMTNKEKIKINQLRHQGYSYGKISVILSLSENTIKSYCRRNSLTTNMIAKTSYCKQCNNHIIIKENCKPRQFCSDKCRIAWWTTNNKGNRNRTTYQLICTACGKPFESDSNKTRKYCSHKCYIASRFGKEHSNG